jgi:hypothetical protein
MRACLTLLALGAVCLADPPDPTVPEATQSTPEIEAAASRDYLTTLVSASDLICVAKVEFTSIRSSHGIAAIGLQLSVEQVLKGPGKLTGQEVEAFYTALYGGDEDGWIKAEAPSGKMIVFLQLDKETGRYHLPESLFGVLPYSSTGVIAVHHQVAESATVEKAASGK